ncbi:SIMPL domain-containing protein [Butyrivibrio sp. JL13D10]|uniref:SIMPL domain-containing protein n=1 Tax=Butyrivibrio sp. JL13D10 TaxID=3236815 RepID=UPI0038B44AF9
MLSAAAMACGLYMFRSNREHTIIATGSASVDFTSDLVKWSGSFCAEASTSTAAYNQIQKDVETVKSFLLDNGITEDEMQFNAINISEKTHNIYDTNGNRVGEESDGYRPTQSIQVTSSDIDKVERVSREVSVLLEKGIEFSSYNCEYYYTGRLLCKVIRKGLDNFLVARIKRSRHVLQKLWCKDK